MALNRLKTSPIASIRARPPSVNIFDTRMFICVLRPAASAVDRFAVADLLESSTVPVSAVEAVTANAFAGISVASPSRFRSRPSIEVDRQRRAVEKIGAKWKPPGSWNDR